MQIIIKQWYDLITPESASNGDYEATGLGMIDNATSDIIEAVAWYLEALDNLGYYEINQFNGKIDYANEVAYASDPIVDYSDASEERHAVAVIMPKNIQAKFNRLVELALKNQVA
jgi:hypothetical protein